MFAEHYHSERFSRCERTVRRWFPVLASWMLTVHSASALLITNVSPVNITPGSFSIVWASTPPIIPAISVYADAAGTSSLAGQVGIEFYPLSSGNPTATNGYDQRSSRAAIRQKSQNMGLVQVQVTGCTPGSTYYYRLQVSNTNGQTLSSPASGPLPSVTTAVENSFVIQSQQLVIDLPGIDPSGSIVLLSNSNSPSRLAAVAGDGAAFNQVFFSLNDLLASLGNTNFLPLGDQVFTATVLGSHTNSVQTFSLYFSTDFLVGQGGEFSFNPFFALIVGSSVLRAGTTSSIPITLYASGITNLSFVLDLPTNRLAAVSLQALAPQLNSVVLTPVASNLFLATLTTAAGLALQGNQEIAQLNFTAVSNQPSAFLPLSPQTVQGISVGGSSIANIAVQPGRIVIVGNEPLLEASLGPQNLRDLTLFGKPWSSYEIQYSTNVANPAAWKHLMRVPVTNLSTVLVNMDASLPAAFYRAYEFTTREPLLDLVSWNRFLLYGTPGMAYGVEYATSLSVPTTWIPLMRVPLTNSFTFLNGLVSTNASVSYRAYILSGDPPLLDAMLVNQARSLVVYGQPGTNYVLQYSTNLSNVTGWYPLLNYKLINSFQFINSIGNTAPRVFYRIKKQ